MNLRVLAASTIVGVTSFATASFAQDEVHMSRAAQPNTATAVTYGMSVTEPARQLESARLPAGMLPEVPTGPVQPASGAPTTVPHPGGDLRRTELRN